MRKLIYIAAPLFNDSEKRENLEMAERLEEWCNTYLPQRDGSLIPKLVQSGISPAAAYQLVFNEDLSALRRCDGLVLNLNGRSVDEGAAFELGVAFSLGKPCVGFCTDVRTLLPWGQNPMVTVPLSAIFCTVGDLSSWARWFARSDEKVGEGSIAYQENLSPTTK